MNEGQGPADIRASRLGISKSTCEEKEEMFIALKARECKKRANLCHASHCGFTAHVLYIGKGLFSLIKSEVTERLWVEFM